MHARLTALAASVTMAGFAAFACAQPDDGAGKPPAGGAEVAPAAGDCPSWMVEFPDTPDMWMGADEKEILAYLKSIKSVWPKEKQNWEEVIWKQVLLFQTPRHKVSVPGFRISKYEVTNAQWEVFLAHRMDTYTTEKPLTLSQLAQGLWGLDLGKQAPAVQNGWMTLLRANAGVLQPILNPKQEEKWDPLRAQAQDKELPAGLALKYPRYLPPLHWKNGEVPSFERRRPVRGVTWESAMDFAAWAGLHLPTEAQWERAARGTEGRAFPWGATWDPLRCVWNEYNRAARAAVKETKDASIPFVLGPGQTADTAPNESPLPVEVDSFPQTGTPEGVLHMVGNVSEFVLEPARSYTGSSSAFRFEGQCRLARGGGYGDRPEVLLASERGWEGPHGGAMTPTFESEHLGIRLAGMASPGEQMGLAPAEIWMDRFQSVSPTANEPLQSWLPLPPGYAKSDKGEVDRFLGFSPQLAGGVLERRLDGTAADLAVVTGPAAGVTFLPVRCFPQEHVKTWGEVTSKWSKDADSPLLLGLLLGTENAVIEVLKPGEVKDGVEGKPVAEKVRLGEDRFSALMSLQQRYRSHLGAMLVLHDGKVWVYAPTALGRLAKFRDKPIGWLAGVEVKSAKKDDAPSGKVENGEAVLTSVIPLMSKGEAAKDAPKWTNGVSVTLRFGYSVAK